MPVRVGFPESKNYIGQVQVISSPIFSTSCGLLQLALSKARKESQIVVLTMDLLGKFMEWLNKLKDFFMMG
jgi:hypothetical protein